MVEALREELEACEDPVARELRLSAFAEAEKEVRELQDQETETMAKLRDALDREDSAEVAAVSCPS